MITTGFEPTDRLLLLVERANNLPVADLNGSSDPYVVLKLNDSFEKRTRIIKKNLNPVWNEEFLFFSLGGRDPLVVSLEVYDWDRFSKDDFLGSTTLHISSKTIPFNIMSTTCLTLQHAKSGSLTIHYQISRKDDRASGMFPAITSTNLPSSPSDPSYFNYEFSPMFCPSLPMNFKLLSTKKENRLVTHVEFEGPFDKPVNNIKKEPGILQICYFTIPKNKFAKVHSEYMSSYLTRVKQSTEVMNDKLMEDVKDRDVTSLFTSSSPQYKKVLENTNRANTTEGLLTVVSFSCLVGESTMALFTYLSYSYEAKIRMLLIKIVKASKIVELMKETSPKSSSPIDGISPSHHPHHY